MKNDDGDDDNDDGVSVTSLKFKMLHALKHAFICFLSLHSTLQQYNVHL